MSDTPPKRPSDKAQDEEADLQKQIEIGMEIMREHAETFKALARSSDKGKKAE